MWGESQYYFVFLSVSSLSWQKWGEKMHLNWYVLASLQHLENGEASGWRHMETQAWLLSLPYRAGAERSDQETAGRKGQRQQRGVAFGAVDISPVLQDSPGSWALSSGAQGRLRLRRDHVNSERGARETAWRGPCGKKPKKPE